MKKTLSNIVVLLTGLLVLITILSFAGEHHYFLELFTHFRLQYLLLFSISFLFFIIFLNKKWMILSLIGLLLNVVPVSSIFFPVKDEINNKKRGENTVSLLLTNVLSNNRNHHLLLNEIQKKQPDFLVILELSPQWAKGLSQLDSSYPYHKVIPRSDNFGIALYSKYPLQNIEVKDFGQNNLPSIVAKSLIENEEIDIIATHPFPPINKSAAEEQKRHLNNLAGYIAPHNKSNNKNKRNKVLVAGDFNSTLWSPRYTQFIRDAKLINTRQGKGIYPTWPAEFKFPALQIPLDHILTSKQFKTHKIERLDSIGSDHLPLYVELGL